MDLAYICEWEKWPKSTHCPSVPLACTWSCRNLIAFTTDLRSDDQDLTRMIHILDTEHPWDVHSVCSEHSEAITCLEWDQSGSRLLSADADGQIKCWSMADHLANSWESPVGSLVEGDPIVALSWLHNGVKLALHVEKGQHPCGQQRPCDWRGEIPEFLPVPHGSAQRPLERGAAWVQGAELRPRCHTSPVVLLTIKWGYRWPW
ncbi:mediator of RNA polymerase II transcription subunit 16 [Physeter macrocephalus]|uniref:Mediator of RNA polymerase II transcription subunit 16 n=1 Tax=Physeter macrocephalus TaxID=9755 RepID=A0A455BRW0_PHYMC|nr:mediator of RNA polymerase II transcription subunit 16 [Physeter catodon]XP_028351708.1 mediator of RNA polymerase II transcription subunit 16 [Physeter catodon]XP_028351709.1 mediator of RNA polymerase II transcription subunit 16 [Physeter catodon]|eukprot:XP_028351703.1 mediator of RNA polymerase II transcription subunit 16 [Physeter catodon]